MEAKAAARTATTVCVTGAGGFVGSWLVHRLLAAGRYKVHATVRDPGDAKNAHLAAMGGAAERLRLFGADVLDGGAVAAAVAGCDGVFHVACPVPDYALADPEARTRHHISRHPFLRHALPACSISSDANNEFMLQAEMLAPAVTGTMNVMKACSEAKVKRVVVVSSLSAVLENPAWPEGKAMDESCWSDVEVCRATENWYCLSKTLAELEAWDYAKRTGLDMVTLCPSLVIGPLLQSTVNASSAVLVDFLKGDRLVKMKLRNFVDVRDVADALLLVYETPEASGRYICNSHPMHVSDVIKLLKSWYPEYKYATKFVHVSDEPSFNSKKLQALGWKCKPLEDTLKDSVESFRKAGASHQ
ncbi:unnamed protein product [Urochloa decumbens]|uniref:NAD(P)-binding domain-containing protein n=1 Tax=Urochloa decumbens TaxID=240449 RepID=A0ABC9E344_9POAL